MEKFQTSNKSTFLFLSILSLVVLIFLVFFFWYLTSPRIIEISRILAVIVQLTLALFVITVSGGLFLIVLSSITERDFLFPYGKKQITLKVLFPINIFIGSLFGWSKDRVRQSFVAVNNSLFKATSKRMKKGKLLVLLSQCLQNYDCPYKVTAHFENCKMCGNCQIGDIIKIGKRYNLALSIATGGTLARKVVVDTKPTAIVAVACERDLTSGIQDVYPIPVYGILNQRPFGPCVNTRVDMEKIEQAVRFIINGRE
jgi:hypothetical protein